MSKALQEDIASFGEEESGGGVTMLLRVPDMKIHLVTTSSHHNIK